MECGGRLYPVVRIRKHYRRVDRIERRQTAEAAAGVLFFCLGGHTPCTAGQAESRKTGMIFIHIRYNSSFYAKKKKGGAEPPYGAEPPDCL